MRDETKAAIEAGARLRDDGATRTDKQQLDIDLMMARVFAGEDGARCLAYLRAITIEQVMGPAATDSALRHLEGQRYIVSIVQRCLNRAQRAPAAS